MTTQFLTHLPKISKAFPFTLLILLSTSVESAILSFDYTGSIISSDGIVSTGTSFYGSFSYDDGLAPRPYSDRTIYGPANFSLTIDGTQIDFAGALEVDNDSTLLVDSDFIHMGSNSPDPTPTLNGVDVGGITISLIDRTQTVLSDEALPTSFDLSEWGSKTLAIRRLDDFDDITYGRIDTLAPSVPIPAAAWLFGSALLGLGLVKRKKA